MDYKGYPHKKKKISGRILLASERLKRKLTQEDVAKHCCVSRCLYTMIEGGTKTGSDDFWEKIEELFSMDSSSLKKIY